MRHAPAHIVARLKRYAPAVDLQWDERLAGWRLVYAGRPQPAILQRTNDRGETEDIQNLDGDELMRILHLGDLHNYAARFRERQRARAREREYERQRRAARYREDTLRPAMRDLARFVIKQRRQPRPFIAPKL